MAARAADPGDTIFALSSGRPPCAIAVMRISGPEAGRVLAQLAGSLPHPRHAELATVRDKDGALLDRAVLLWFPAPQSSTGEDVAELHLHGSPAVVSAVSQMLIEVGLRLAEPGEFTRRALINGKLDLAEVEGLADLLVAETETQRRDAQLRATGVVGRLLESWSKRLVNVAASIEAVIDYDGEAEVAAAADIRPAVASLVAEIGTVLARMPAERLRDGIRVAIVGPPNLGKSTLFNAILRTDAAIVSDVAGTTRDLIERPVSIAGIPFILIDTAGQRPTADPIERAGVERAAAIAAIADLVLDLGPRAASDQRVIAVSARADIAPTRAGTLAVSARTGEGMSALLEEVVRSARSILPPTGEAALDRRHREAAGAACDALSRVAGEDDLLIVAEHLIEAREALDRVTGRAGVEPMLDALFSRFCLGK